MKYSKSMVWIVSFEDFSFKIYNIILNMLDHV